MTNKNTRALRIGEHNVSISYQIDGARIVAHCRVDGALLNTEWDEVRDIAGGVQETFEDIATDMAAEVYEALLRTDNEPVFILCPECDLRGYIDEYCTHCNGHGKVLFIEPLNGEDE